MVQKTPLRVLIAKPGLDGHCVGAKVVCRALRDAGMEVIYTGLHRTCDEIVEVALQEDVDVIGLSILSGAHLQIAKKMMAKLKDKGMSDVPVTIGGVIPQRDIAVLKKSGIAGVCPVGTPLEKVIETVSQIARNTTIKDTSKLSKN